MVNDTRVTSAWDLLAFPPAIHDDARMNMVVCRYCGHPTNASAPNCGNCGQALAGGGDPASPLGAPEGPLAAGRGPLGGLVKPLLMFVVGGIVALAFLVPVWRQIEDAVSSTRELPERLQGQPGEITVPEPEPAVGYASVRELVKDLRSGGVPCRPVSIDASDGTVESGSCTVRGAHVQILIYRTQAAVEFADVQIYDEDWPFTYVHDDNWFVTTAETPLARRIRRALGGTLSVAGSD